MHAFPRARYVGNAHLDAAQRLRRIVTPLASPALLAPCGGPRRPSGSPQVVKHRSVAFVGHGAFSELPRLVRMSHIVSYSGAGGASFGQDQEVATTIVRRRVAQASTVVQRKPREGRVRCGCDPPRGAGAKGEFVVDAGQKRSDPSGSDRSEPQLVSAPKESDTTLIAIPIGTPPSGDEPGNRRPTGWSDRRWEETPSTSLRPHSANVERLPRNRAVFGQSWPGSDSDCGFC